MALQKIWQQFYDERVPKSIDYPDLNLYQLLQLAVEENRTGVATLFFGARQKYGQLDQLVNRFADGLFALGIRKGDRVALLLPNLPGYVIAHFAVLKLGAILVPTNPLYVERELEHQLRDSGSIAVITLDRLYPRLAKVRESTGVKKIIVMGIQDFLPRVLSYLYRLKERPKTFSDSSLGIYSYCDFMSKRYSPTPAVSVEPDDVAMFLYTGGTTGISKGAVLTHRNLVVNVHQTRAWLWEIGDRQEILLCALPFFHSYGLTTGLHLAIMCQSAMLLLPRFELSDVAKQIKKHRPTVFCGVPSMYNAINRYPDLSSEDVSSIRICISGGAALPSEVQRRFEERTGGKLVEGYGLTETAPVAVVNPTHGHRKSGTIGVPIPDTEAKVIDPSSGEEMGIGEVGELALRGPQVMKEYWRKAEETANVLKDGWLHTGDMAAMDEEGFIRIVDRKKDLIISAGMTIYPREVEEVLQQHPKVVEAAAIGVASEVREEVVKAFVVIEEGETLTKGEIVQFCRDKLSKFKIPRQVEFVAELPKSAMGKVLRRKLKDAED
jgi:long-chain acyl-CoA synthetase